MHTCTRVRRLCVRTHARPALLSLTHIYAHAHAHARPPHTHTLLKRAQGDSVTWTNNAGFPHNVVFDEDAVPDGVDVDSLSSYDLLNAPGESHSATFDVAGTYEYYCEPHQGAGMAGKVVVN